MSIIISMPCGRCLSQTGFQAHIIVSLPYKPENVSLNGIGFQNLLLSLTGHWSQQYSFYIWTVMIIKDIIKKIRIRRTENHYQEVAEVRKISPTRKEIKTIYPKEHTDGCLPSFLSLASTVFS